MNRLDVLDDPRDARQLVLLERFVAVDDEAGRLGSRRVAATGGASGWWRDGPAPFPSSASAGRRMLRVLNSRRSCPKSVKYCGGAAGLPPSVSLSIVSSPCARP